MKKVIRHYYLNTTPGYYFLHPFFFLFELFLKSIPDEVYLKYKFKKLVGYPLNLKNPSTFNEKISFLKLYDKNNLQTIAADKFLVRQYIEKTIGSKYLIPLVYHTKNPKEINPQNLPDYPIIIKTNHNSSGGVIVMDKNKKGWGSIQSSLSRLLKENFYYFSREWQYKNIEPRIVVEKLLMDEKGNIPNDYKLHCFNGKLVFTQLDLNRHVSLRRNLYDVEWNKIPCQWKYENGEEVSKPRKYEEMKILAEKIAADFTYVRVDFYIVNDEIFFGELTFHPGSGFQKFYPISYDYKFGELLNIEAHIQKKAP